MPDVEQGAPPDYTAMPAVERLAKINNYRARLVAGEKLTDDELRDGLRLLRAERLSRTGETSKAAPAEPKKPSKMKALLDGI